RELAVGPRDLYIDGLEVATDLPAPLKSDLLPLLAHGAVRRGLQRATQPHCGVLADPPVAGLQHQATQDARDHHRVLVRSNLLLATTAAVVGGDAATPHHIGARGPLAGEQVRAASICAARRVESGHPDDQVQHAVTVAVAQRSNCATKATAILGIRVGDGLYDVARARAQHVHGAHTRTSGAGGDLSRPVTSDVAETRERRPENASRDRGWVIEGADIWTRTEDVAVQQVRRA